MSVSYIPEKTKVRLWGKAAGRCQYKGCTEPLWYDGLTKAEFNSAYIAHIVADKPDGPRGDIERSEILKQDISNLMLMCDAHHRLIDRQKVDEHSEEVLLQMKKEHEDKMELLTSLTEDKQSHVLLYGANIGGNKAKLSMDEAIQAMLPNKYPADKNPIELSLSNSSLEDHEEFYWKMERMHLQRQYKDKVEPRLKITVNHMSVFAMAPQPLLIELGRLITDIQPAEVYQPHRDPDYWMWEADEETFDYQIIRPEIKSEIVALNISLSASIDNSRIYDVLGGNVSIWTITIDSPYNDFLRSREQLQKFREKFRKLMNAIKKEHGQHSEIHLFPAAPVAIAVEIGRAWMPKADLPLKVYDQNKLNNQFEYTLEIN
ncbi:SAVED domain-containing protein [Bacillus hwajinpoensis]|uniref:SAVED domain-containing protein n=1 Tax=Guptibacillus hwajinpoensis TaxID=208199 RepID=A0A845F0C1_9BACL|nr:SAVED domain-containing protein [Pseudalkalibacillus hwajinpoensis]MYL64187.1 SAVED domain-containing protein [Pseudalkalibacillus hwajinpoensis]